ncbi:MAG: UDP-galactopyranose mutase [Clostridiales Family XIII bacterium]|jgi:UDP-galactopyranose mutase|nr:UDP-galactopyranose mutase [Clostridiales Family XIII bacterium]
MYDYLIVGAGLFGATFAYEASRDGKKCLVIDRRPHAGGNVRCESVEGINVHRYGPHIFHTDDRGIWEYMNRFAEFNRYTNAPLANYRGELYNLPFNMNTFYRLWGTASPAAARAEMERQRVPAAEPRNLEEQALSLVGRDIYEKLIKGYTEKQWGRKCSELPAFIIRRIPLRFSFDNSYFSDRYQGVPIGGYNRIIEGMLEKCDLRLGTDYFSDRDAYGESAAKTVYTGMIDEYYGHMFGGLEYRSLVFETEVMDMPDFQGNAVVNYTSAETPYTRIIEHKHFEFGTQEKTVITREYPKAWAAGDEPYYPVNDAKNAAVYGKYLALAEREEDVFFGGRLGSYRYLDMWQVVSEALRLYERLR